MKLFCEVSGIRVVVLGDIVFKRYMTHGTWTRVDGYTSYKRIGKEIDQKTMVQKIKRFTEDPRYHVWVSGDTVNIHPVGKQRIHESDE